MNNPNDMILRTEDGHPIGEIVVSMDESRPQWPSSEQVTEENRDELMRVQASEILEEADADKSVMELYPGYADSEKRKLARKLFIIDQKPIAKVAAECGVPERTVSLWSYNGKWVDLVQKELEVRQAHSRLELARLRAERRAKVARAQLDAAEMIRDKVTGELSDMSAKTAAEALKSAADVEARILGIKETGEMSETSPSEQSQASGRTPLVMVFQGGLPPVRRSSV